MKFNDTITEELYNLHKLWLSDFNIGNRLNLTNADLTNADLTNANLKSANLTNADLTNANLKSANLKSANLTYANLKSANLTNANLTNANLKSANLTNADLTNADLSDISINNTIGNNKEIKTLQLAPYIITISYNIMAIGCKQYTIDDWYTFNDDKINIMDSGALQWWHKYKDFIKQYISLN